MEKQNQLLYLVCEEKLLTCKFCRERFENAGALSTHIKYKHSVVISQPGEQSSSSGSVVVVNLNDDEELEGPSMETFHQKPQENEMLEIERTNIFT